MMRKYIISVSVKLYNHIFLPVIDYIVFGIKKIQLKKHKVRILSGARFSKDCKFEGYNSVGSNSKLNCCALGLGSYIGANQMWSNISVGRFCSIGSNVHIITGRHPISEFASTHPAFFSKSTNAAGYTFVSEQKFEEQPKTDKGFYVEIGNDVWIGDNVTIMSGCKIGDGAVIGANALVTKDIHPYSVNIGIPAKIIRYRFPEADIAKLQKKRWWDKSIEWISANADNFTDINKLFKNL